jgi:large subunit ribosomal protein L29
MKQQEIAKLSVDDLKGRLDYFREQLSKLKLTHVVAPLDNPIQIKNIRKTVARLSTELTKRELQA